MLKKRMRWLAAALICLCLCPAAAAEEPACAVQLADSALLIDAQGNTVETEVSFGTLYRLYDGTDGLPLYMGQAEGDLFGSYALVDGQGKLLTGFDYEMLEYTGGCILAWRGGRMGAMDPAGNILIEPVYTSLISDGAGGYLALRTDLYDDTPDAVYLVGADGSEQRTGIMAAEPLYGFTEGMCPVQSADSGLYGYIGPDGQWLIEPAYDWAGPFEGGFALVNRADAVGLIASDGTWAIEPEKDVHISCGRSAALRIDGDEAAVIDLETGEQTALYKESDVFGYALEDGAAVVVLNDRTVVVDRSGSEILSAGASAMVNQWADMKEHLIVSEGIQSTGGTSLYRMDGEYLAGPFRDVMPLGMAEGRMYYVYTDYDVQETEYPELGMSLWDEVPGTRRCGVLSPDGEVLCGFEADYISYVGGDCILVEREDKLILSTLTGGVIREFEGGDQEEAAV